MDEGFQRQYLISPSDEDSSHLQSPVVGAAHHGAGIVARIGHVEGPEVTTAIRPGLLISQ